MAVNIYDVAKRAGVCVVTVSRVINGVASVRESNRQKVLRAMDELGYTPSAAARALARGNSGVLGMLVPILTDPFMAEVVTGAAETARRYDLLLMLCITGEDEKEVGAAVKMYSEGRVDGMLVLAPASRSLAPRLRKSKAPFVLLDQDSPSSSAVSVTVNNFQAGYLATKHLIELGHRRIGHLSGTPTYQSSSDRVRGFEAAMHEHGLPFKEMIRPCHFNPMAGYLVAKQWLSESDRPTAIFAADDQMAFGVYQAAGDLGLDIPRDLSLVGVDDNPLCQYVGAGLTTVRQPMREMGSLGVHLLDRMLAKEDISGTIRVLEPQLVVRGSTGRPQ